MRPICFSTKSCILYSFIGLIALCVLFENANCASAEESVKETESENDAELEKRAIDKMRFYGGLGKRSYDSYESFEDSDEYLPMYKRLDKMRYFGALGKRNSENQLEKYKSAKRLDKMKYFGGLGKRSLMEFSDLNKNTLNNLAKKSKNIDRLRFMGSLGK